MIEDEASIADAVAARLRSEGFDGRDRRRRPGGRRAVRALQPDLVVLDLMLPGLDGLEVCRRIQRDRPVPVLMLTARDAETDLLVGLGVGADDYMTKPFSRASSSPASTRCCAGSSGGRRRAGDADAARRVELDPAARRVRLDGELVHLTPTEFDLLALLAARPGAVFTREELLAEVWGYATAPARAPSTRTCARCAASSAPTVIRTVHGVGYALEERRMRPLDRLPLDQAQARRRHRRRGAVTVFVFSVGQRLGLWLPVRATLAAAVLGARDRAVPRARHDVAAAGDGRRRDGDGPRRLRPPRERDVARRGRRARARVQPDGRRAAETDRLRRDLVANVCHELRTPITALQAVLENLVDGVEPPDPADAPHHARPGRAARPAGRAAARPVPARVRRAAARAVAVRVAPLLEQAVRECALGDARRCG